MLAGLVLFGATIMASRCNEPEQSQDSPSPSGQESKQEEMMSAGTERVVLVLTVNGPISPATSDYLMRGFREAKERNAYLILIRMDTPGGLTSSMRDIIKEILNSPIPVVTYVSPPGARAASAGTYMLYASHVAAMAPSTNLGSATPVQMGGLPGSPDGPEEEEPGKGRQPGDAGSQEKDPESPSEQQEKRTGKTAMERKVLEDSVAYIRGLAERHGRNADWAEKAVRDAVNLTATDAVKINVIDIVAGTDEELMRKMDGLTVRMSHDERTLKTEGLTFEEYSPDWRHRLLSVIANPNVAYFLMLIGFYGIIFELSNPGAIYPGVIGAISLLLALYAFQVLPINYAGLGLIILGLALILAEAFVAGFGVLGIGGVVAFVAGSVILMDDQNLAVSLPLIGGTALVAAGFLAWVLTRLVAFRRQRSSTGEEGLIGRVGEATSDFEGRGRVRLGGEIWWANYAGAAKKGQKLRVVSVDGLELKVEPWQSE